MTKQRDPLPGDTVHVRIKGRLGVIQGLSLNPQPLGAGEAVYTVKLLDDGSLVDAGVSSLGDPRELDAPEAAEAAAAEAAETPAEAEETPTGE